MTLHHTTFQYHSPTEEQRLVMERARTAAAAYASVLDELLPPGPDKTYIMRELRTLSMWANVAITRNADGSPRQ